VPTRGVPVPLCEDELGRRRGAWSREIDSLKLVGGRSSLGPKPSYLFIPVASPLADRGRASGLYRVGITGKESHASPFTKWSKYETVMGISDAEWARAR
jgi:hypothetical protein